MRQRQTAPNKVYHSIPLQLMNKKLTKPVELVVKEGRQLIRQRQLLPENIYKVLLEQMQEDLENRISKMKEKRIKKYNEFLLLKNKRKEGFITKNQEIFFSKDLYEEQLNINGQKLTLRFSQYEKIKQLLDDRNEMIQRMKYMINLMKKYQDHLNNQLKDKTKDLVYQTKMAIIYKKKVKKLESQLDKKEKQKNKRSKISVSGLFGKNKRKKQRSKSRH